MLPQLRLAICTTTNREGYETYPNSVLQHDLCSRVVFCHLVVRGTDGIDRVVDEEDGRAGIDCLEFCWAVSQ